MIEIAMTPPPTLTRQTGVALITAMIFLVVLTLLATAGMRGTLLEERMAANSRNHDLAFQAAEAALREGILEVQNGTITPTSGFTSACPGGLCLPSTTGIDNATAVFPFGQTTPSASAMTYSGTALSSVANQPQYIVELLPDTAIPPGNSLGGGRTNPSGTATPYRITARGWGMTAEAQATTQATYLNY